jgi:hypothetical protein
MLMMKEKRAAIRTLRGWAISVLREAGAIQESIATEIYVPWNVGDQGKSRLVVLNVSFVARDPLQTNGAAYALGVIFTPKPGRLTSQ